MDDALYSNQLRLFASGDENAAQAAFDVLWKEAESSLTRTFRRYNVPPDQWDDYRQEIAIRMWKVRKTFESQGISRWFSYIGQVAWSVIVDDYRRRGVSTPLDLEQIGEIPDSEIRHVDSVVAARSDRRFLYQVADECWLKVSSNHAANRKRLLAAQYFYVDGEEPEAIAALLLPGNPRGVERIERWLTDPGVIRHLAYHHLYWSNDQLSGYLLCPEKPLSPSELDRAREIERVADQWTEEETRLVLWRYRNGLHDDQIERFGNCDRTDGERQEFYDRCVAAFPIESRAKALREALDRTRASKHLKDDGLWKRIVFEYDLADELPHKQIVERADPPAKVCGSMVNLTRLNGWLSMDRLVKALMKFLDERRKDA